MNFGQLKTMVWTWLDDPNHLYFTDSVVSTWLNNAQKETQKQLIQAGENFYVTKVYANTVADTDTYALPDDFLKLNKLQIATSGTGTVTEVRQGISPVTLVQLDQVSMSTGTPAVHCIRKNCITLRPIPSQAWRIYLDYSYLVADMTEDSNVPDVPEQYHEYLAVLATLDGFLRDRRDPSSMIEKRDFYRDMMKQDAEDRHVDAPREVVVTEEWGSGAGW